MKKYKLVVAIEGIDGAGKTTLVNALKNELDNDICIYSRTKKGKIAKSLLNHFPLNRSHILQIPFYHTLSIINFLKREQQKSASILLMDRCFLSNICYYYPVAMNNRLFYFLAMLFEVKVLPKMIFIIDEEAEIAQKRDKMEKSLEWLKHTRLNYLKAKNAKSLRKYDITIIPNTLSIENKLRIIKQKISEGMRKNDIR